MADVQQVRGELEACERTIERGLNTFIEVGIAIRQIRDNKLYKEDYGTFEEYCRERWGWSRGHAYRQMEAADTAQILSPIGDIPNESQTRALAPLAKEDPDEANRVYREVKAEHGDNTTAKHLDQAAKEIKTARAIRSQLPDSVRAVVEESEPEDHSLSRNPAQLRHLLDVSQKHGEERSAELALRVADGEFQSTFEAYDVIREERGESKPLLPKQEPDALEKWNSAMYDIELRLNSIRDMGGIKSIPSAWLPEKKEVLRERLLRMSKTLNEIASEIGGDDE